MGVLITYWLTIRASTPSQTLTQYSTPTTSTTSQGLHEDDDDGLWDDCESMDDDGL